MWPYGYTYTNMPSDMTVDDQAALVYIGKKMASTNGYKPEQASDLYISSGTSRDYLYGTYRTFSYTFEMSIRDYPDDALIAAETDRNKEAVLYLMERAWCPLSVRGATVTAARCGAYDDDMEVRRGWTVNPDGTDTARSTSRFVRSNPASTAWEGAKQLGTTTSGSIALVTGAPAGTSANTYDLDGRTSIRSARIKLPATIGQRLTFRYVFAHDDRGHVVRSVPGDRRSRGRHADRGAGSLRQGARHERDLAFSRRSRWTDGPARRSICASWPRMPARTTSSRSRSTTSGSPGPRLPRATAVRGGTG